VLEVRLPWGLLNVSDPSTGTVLYEEKEGDEIGTAKTDGFRIGVAVIGTRMTPAGEPALIGALPVPGVDGQWRVNQFTTWQWPLWTVPRYHQRLKPVYDSLRAIWGR